MDQSLTELVKSGIVEPDEALDRAIDKESFKLYSEPRRSKRAPPGLPR